MRWSRKLGLCAWLAVLVASPGLAAPLSGVKLIASDAAEHDYFGFSIAVAGDTLVVGALFAEVGGVFSAGAAYVFRRDAGGGYGWTETNKLTASDPSLFALFGESVSISGDTIVVGAGGDGDPPLRAGSAYIFQRNWGGNDNWGQVKKLTAADPGDGDEFGQSVAISGDTVAVGAQADADAGADSGSVYVFERNWGGSDNWGQVKKLTAAEAAEGDHFGRSVAISGDRIAVGADTDSDMGAYSGSAYIFERDFGGTSNWGQVKQLNASDQTTFDHFGWFVAIDGDRAVVGMPWDDDPFHKSGSAYIFERDFGGSGNWGEVKKIQAADPSEGEPFGFGWSMAVSSDRVLVGSNSASVYLFERDEGGPGSWGQVTEFVGEAVAISGNTIAMGNQWDTEAGADAGAAYVYAPAAELVPTTGVWGLALLSTLLLLTGVTAPWALADRADSEGEREGLIVRRARRRFPVGAIPTRQTGRSSR
jgi:hypothetical protein